LAGAGFGRTGRDPGEGGREPLGTVKRSLTIWTIPFVTRISVVLNSEPLIVILEPVLTNLRIELSNA